MLTRIRIRNFKKLGDVSLELGKSVVFIGPNNSGKTTALQALALWEMGLRQWSLKRKGKTPLEKRPGVTLNRKELMALPVPDAKLLWRNLHVRDVERGEEKQKTRNVRIDILVEGITNGVAWTCGFEFDYANEESLYCRPLRLSEESQPLRMSVPEEAVGTRIAFLPPMSGLAEREFIKELGEIGVLIGQGQTAQVLRNLCYRIYTNGNGENRWTQLAGHIQNHFGVTLLPPCYLIERSEIVMSYREVGGVELDISSSGRGLQQTLLLLAHLYANPGTILLLDEPDAHLEILRQRQMYQLITEVAEQQGSQIVAASHSEVVLNEAAERDIVIAFVGQPHRMDGRGSQVLKSLREIGFEHYYQAEQTGWVLYLEGATDLAILQAFAATLHHPAAQVLERPFVHYVGNQMGKARDHFYALREAKPDFCGIALLDSDSQKNAPPPDPLLQEMRWQRREVENYVAQVDVLLAYARHDESNDLFSQAEADAREKLMRELIQDRIPPIAFRDPTDRWWAETKATDSFLDPLFETYFKRLGLPNLLRKTDYHVLARLVPVERIESEVVEKLDAILALSAKAHPLDG